MSCAKKPLTVKLAEYEALSQAIAQTKRTVFTVHNWKYAPIFQKAFALLREGRIGPVWHVDIFTLRDKRVPRAAGALDPEDWRRKASVAGGGFWSTMVGHSFYLLMNVLNATPQKILAKMLKDRQDPESLEEAVQALVQFPEADGYIHLTLAGEAAEEQTWLFKANPARF